MLKLSPKRLITFSKLKRYFVHILAIFFNSLIALVFCAPVVSFCHVFGQWLAAFVLRVSVREISIGWGPIVWTNRYFMLRILPFWFWLSYDSLRLHQKFLLRSSVKNYVKMMAPKSNQKHYFDELGFFKKLLFLFSGSLFNVFLGLLLYLLIIINQIHFDLEIFFKTFLTQILYGFLVWFGEEINLTQINGVNFLYSLFSLNCFFILVNFLPVYFFDGQAIYLIFLEKIFKKSINGGVTSFLDVLGISCLIWLMFGFFVRWQA